MKAYTIQARQSRIKASIQLPLSKSISNRALILNAVRAQLKAEPLSIPELAHADDTLLMQAALSSNSNETDVKNAGTCLCFLCALKAALPGEHTLYSSNPRMLLRPITPLITALKSIGAHILQSHPTDALPIQIMGQVLQGGTVSIEAHQSSQFVSALMMMGPLTQEGLCLQLQGEQVSKAYIGMTQKMMQQFGFSCEIEANGKQIRIAPGMRHKAVEVYSIEPDWSSAAFFYQAALLAEEADIFFAGLSLPSIQGDAILPKWFEPMGIQSTLSDKGLRIRKTLFDIDALQEIDFTDHPDLAPALICATAAAGIPLHANGLTSLLQKESNRLEALVKMLQQLHFEMSSDHASYLHHEGYQRKFYQQQILNTENDHRLAMAYAMLSLQFGEVRVSEIQSVIKSFPNFFYEANKLGIQVLGCLRNRFHGADLKQDTPKCPIYETQTLEKQNFRRNPYNSIEKDIFEYEKIGKFLMEREFETCRAEKR